MINQKFKINDLAMHTSGNVVRIISLPPQPEYQFDMVTVKKYHATEVRIENLRPLTPEELTFYTLAAQDDII